MIKFNLNMEDRIFKQDDLIPSDWQYVIRHTDVNCFVCGEKVFLKSNSEHQMTIHSINESTITTFWYSKTNEIQFCDFPPECILQYKYAGLLSYRQKVFVSLN